MRKRIAVLLAGVMVCSMLTACGSTEEPKEEPEAKQAYLQEISDNALHKRNIELTENDHLVLLITCTSDMTNGRNILVGRLTDQVYPEKEKAKNLGTGIDKLKEKMIQVPVIYWILLLIIVLLLIDRKLKKKGKKKHENS